MQVLMKRLEPIPDKIQELLHKAISNGEDLTELNNTVKTIEADRNKGHGMLIIGGIAWTAIVALVVALISRSLLK